jgi:hypothetical protein
MSVTDKMEEGPGHLQLGQKLPEVSSPLSGPNIKYVLGPSGGPIRDDAQTFPFMIVPGNSETCRMVKKKFTDYRNNLFTFSCRALEAGRSSDSATAKGS